MKFPLYAVAAALCAVTLSCSGSSSGGGTFRIVSCNLGCSSTSPGGVGQVSCGVQDVFVNGDLRITFTQPVQESSLNLFSLEVTELGTGITPSASRFVDPADERTAVYRPLLTFGPDGTPVFGLTVDQAYTIKLPGVVEDIGAQYIRSQSGQSNKHRMLCTVNASLGVQDAKAGAPTVTVLVDKVLAYDPITGEPSEFALDIPADGEVDVYRFTDIVLVFDDLMNPATLVNPVTGESNTVNVVIDPDGDLDDPSDQIALLGTFAIDLDQDTLTTTVTFTTELGLPSAGSDPLNPRKIAVQISSIVSDLGGNLLANAGEVSFTPELIPFDPVTLVEDFESTLLSDVEGSGADWGGAVAGALLPGIAGGSGRHGDLVLLAGQELVLNTDSEDFSSIADPSILNPASVLGATFDGTDFTIPTVTDGVFEFSSVFIDSGARLRFEGSNPARVFVRGEATILGLLDLAGEDAPEHVASEVFGSPATVPGASGGAGGEGGRLPTWVTFGLLPGTIVPDPAPTPPTKPEIDGQDGEGVVDNTIAPSGTNLGFGGGGPHWPQSTPTFPTFDLPVNPFDISGVVFELGLFCETKMKGGVGAGGGFGLNGTQGENNVVPGAGGTPPEAPLATAGLASEFGVGIGSDPTSPERRLDPEAGFLHGGPGGGGGGGHILTSATNGQFLVDCEVALGGADAEIVFYRQHSGAAGGAGGGAVQLQTGLRTVIDGVINAGGGVGGSKPTEFDTVAGGGGAGGAVLLQSPDLQISSSAGRVDVSGGAGGFGVGASLGGDGGSGLMRFETLAPLPDLATEATKVLPSPTDLAAVGAAPIDVLSLGELTPITVGPGAVNGVQSCWLQPDGNFFVLNFLDDVGDELGWDMTVIPNPPSLGPQSYRGDNDLFLAPLETVFGTALGSAPLVVRFQGARAITTIEDPCDVALGGLESEIFPGSLTGWVEHPAELNTFFADPAKRPNLIRFQILFDTSQASFGALTGVTELTIQTLPD